VPGLDTTNAPLLRRYVALGVVLLAGLGALAGCSDGDDAFTSEGDSTSALDPDQVETTEVEIADLAFTPQQITVAAGTVVQWTNRDLLEEAAPPPDTGGPPLPPAATEHTVTSDEEGRFDSGPLGGEATFSFAFLEPGTYAYHCTIHDTMTGTVEVT
jgi:plastocyanin